MSDESKEAWRITDRCEMVADVALCAAIVLSPWAFGSTEGVSLFLLMALAAVALLSFAVRLVFGTRPVWRASTAGWCVVLGLLVLSSVAGIHQVNLPRGLVHSIAPGVQRWSLPTESNTGVRDVGAESAVDGSNTADVLTGGQAGLEGWFFGNKLGLNAGGSYRFGLQVLMAGCLFAIVSAGRQPALRLRRLALVGLGMGTCLAVFGIAQHFGSHDGLVYWAFEVPGGLGFGPFVNRNHFPFYMNLCLGLGAGLLIDKLDGLGKHWLRALFGEASFSWLIAALAFMFASLVICVSRGGVMSAIIAVMLVMLVRLRPANAVRTTVIVLAIGIPVSLLFVWVGFDLAESRLNMLVETDRYTQDGRWHLWRAALQSVDEFPWFGSGGETYRYWETIHSHADPRWHSGTMQSLRADNEFLDVLCEYGLVGLAGLLLATGGLLWAVLHAARRSGLAAGAAIGVIAVLIHSVVDFGLRVPATGLLAVCVAALMCCQPVVVRKPSRRSRSRRRYQMIQDGGDGASSHQSSDRESRSLQGAVRSAVVGGDGEDASSGIRDRGDVSDSILSTRDTVIRYALAAWLVIFALWTVRVNRRYAVAELAKLSAADQMRRADQASAVAEMGAAVDAVPEAVELRIEYVRTIQAASAMRSDAKMPERWTKEILSQSRIIQRLCPLTWQPSAWLAQYGDADDADRHLQYLVRARRLHPGQPDLAVLAGRAMQSEKGVTAALVHYRDSLTYSTEHLQEILQRLDGQLDASELVDQVLPTDPVVLLRAAQVAPTVSDQWESAVFAEAALLAVKRPEAYARDLDRGETEALRSSALEILGRNDEAIDAMRMALNEDPEQVQWRVRMATLLLAEDRLDQATREVRIALQLRPSDRSAKALQQELVRRKSLLP
ncbi:O-antigen ligase family protein [Crateriforma conspicua]|nr:O-antigen ligase family protein [Crateriforma conspicua]